MHYTFFNPVLALLLACWLPLALRSPAVTENVTVIIEQGSYLKINGSTNVNTFSCHYEGDIGTDTMNIGFQQAADGTLLLQKAKLSVAVARFDCGNQAMNKDFRNLLEYDRHADLNLDILSLQVENSGTYPPPILARVRFTVAGEEKTYEVPVRMISEPGNTTYLGETCLDITDFKLTPPKKFLGMVIVDEEVTLEFNLNFRLI